MRSEGEVEVKAANSEATQKMTERNKDNRDSDWPTSSQSNTFDLLVHLQTLQPSGNPVAEVVSSPQYPVEAALVIIPLISRR